MGGNSLFPPQGITVSDSTQNIDNSIPAQGIQDIQLPMFIFLDQGQGGYTPTQYTRLANVFNKYARPSDYLLRFNNAANSIVNGYSYVSSTMYNIIKNTYIGSSYNSYIDTQGDIANLQSTFPTWANLHKLVQSYDYEPGNTPLDQLPFGQQNCLVGIANGVGPISYSLAFADQTGATLTPAANTTYWSRISGLSPGQVISWLGIDSNATGNNITLAAYNELAASPNLPNAKLGGNSTTSAVGGIVIPAAAGTDASITLGTMSIFCNDVGTSATSHRFVIKVPFSTAGAVTAKALGTITAAIVTANQASTPTRTAVSYVTVGTKNAGAEAITIEGVAPSTNWTIQDAGATLTTSGAVNGVWFIQVTVTFPTTTTIQSTSTGVQYLKLSSNATVPDGTGGTVSGVIWVGLQPSAATAHFVWKTTATNQGASQNPSGSLPATAAATGNNNAFWCDAWNDDLGQANPTTSVTNFTNNLSANRIKAAMTPASINSAAITAISPFLDVYVIQSQTLINNPAALLPTWNSIANLVRAANPKCIIIAQMSTTQSNIGQMIAGWQTLLTAPVPPQGLVLFYNTGSYPINGTADADITAMDAIYNYVLHSNSLVENITITESVATHKN